ncbi:hypothetical protein [Microbacterium sp. 77mftsu3.1]|uniref:hypothetical protein n=1 Tax=Microbacterium sp. 77mftsu3.1 TaxID=1761802 RepID=UPI00037D89B8|nr:hypothetical protein [Microbacterium sp. 77mftsu3.1]SDH51442.1 hypothetical protein SAMN04488590_3494 [Microbacterium sp. 77mftsu3.1]
MSTINISTPAGDGTIEAEAVHMSPRGLYAAVKLTGTDHKGTVDVFHVGTGKRATPPRWWQQVRTATAAKTLADQLDEFDPVEDDGTLRVTREEYHTRYDQLVKALHK